MVFKLLNNFVLFLFVGVVANPLFASDQETTSDKLLSKVRELRKSTPSVEGEIERIHEIYKELGDLSEREALSLEKSLGEEFRRKYSDYRKSKGDLSEAENDLREIFRSAVAVALRGTPAIRINKLMESNPKTYYALSEVYFVAAAIMGADLALVAEIPVVQAFMMAFSLALAPVIGLFVPYKIYDSLNHKSRMRKYMRAFAESAGFRGSSGYKRIQLKLNYPNNFDSCRARLRKLGSS